MENVGQKFSLRLYNMSEILDYSTILEELTLLYSSLENLY